MQSEISSNENESAANGSSAVSKLQQKYERALLKIESMYNENKTLQENTNIILSENQKLKIEQRGDSEMYKLKLQRVKEDYE